MTRLPIRTRLTLWYVGLLGLILVLLGAAGYAAAWWGLRSESDEVLRAKAIGAQTEVETKRGKVTFDTEHSTGGAVSLESGLASLRVWGADLRILHQVEVSPSPPVVDGVLQDALAGMERWQSLSVDGIPFRVLTTPVLDQGKVVGVVQVTRSEAATESLLSLLRTVGGGVVLAGLVLAWFGGNFIAARAIAPVNQIRVRAEEISAADLSRRLGPPHSNDELGQLAQSFDHMIDRLDHAFQHERQFTADASHELRTPLSIIRTQIEVMLAHDRTGEQYRRVLNDVLTEVIRISKLVEDMLVLARIDAGQRLQIVPTALDELVLQVTDRVLSLAVERNISLQIDQADSVTVAGDPVWLTQIALALLENAVRHTPEGGFVGIAVTAASGNAELKVRNSGPGIAPEHLPRIFDRFYRAESSRSRASGGAGLGLAICSWAVRAHGGTIDVSSTSAEGTVFTVKLPLVAVGMPRPGTVLVAV